MIVGMPLAKMWNVSLLSAPLHEIEPPLAVASSAHAVTRTTGGVSRGIGVAVGDGVEVGVGVAVGDDVDCSHNALLPSTGEATQPLSLSQRAVSVLPSPLAVTKVYGCVVLVSVANHVDPPLNEMSTL